MIDWFKYWRQNISVSSIALHTAVQASAHRARETVHLLTHETPDFITPAVWPANSPDLNPVDYQIWGSCRSVCTAARFVTSTGWSRPDRRVGTFSPGGHRWSGQAVASTSSSLHSSKRWAFWTQTLGVLTSCHSHGRTLDSQSRLVPIVDTYAFEWPY